MSQTKNTKTEQVLGYLQRYGSITSMEAIQHFGATRLADVIFRSRKQGYDIQTLPTCEKDRNGHPCNYATYILSQQ